MIGSVQISVLAVMLKLAGPCCHNILHSFQYFTFSNECTGTCLGLHIRLCLTCVVHSLNVPFILFKSPASIGHGLLLNTHYKVIVSRPPLEHSPLAHRRPPTSNLCAARSFASPHDFSQLRHVVVVLPTNSRYFSRPGPLSTGRGSM